MNEQDVRGNTIRRPLRVGIVGMGGRSTSFSHYFSRNPGDGEIVALCDHVPDKARCVARHYGLKGEVYDNVADMLRRATLDALFISTPDYAHVEPAVAGLEAGVHVFCEKPMATTLEDCDTIISAARKSSAVFYLGFNLRHGPIHETVHELITTGRLGKVTTIEANEWYYGGKTYFRRWNRLIKFGGGLWITKACHDFDLLNWMAGAEPATVYATASLSHYNPLPEGANQCRDCKLQFSCPDYYDLFNHGEANPDVMAELRLIGEKHGQEPGDLCLFNADKDTFDNGIAVVTYRNDVRATYTVNVLTARSTRQMRVIGTEGMCEADMGNGTILVTQRHTHRQWQYDMRALMESGHGGADDRLVKDFIHACYTGKQPRTGWAEGRAAVRVALAAQQSMQSGLIVRF